MTTQSVPLTAMAGSGFLKFRVDYENNKDLAVGEGVHSDIVSAGGHLWRIECYPNGIESLSGGDLSLFLRHMSKSANVRGIFEAFLLDVDGVPSTAATRRTYVFRLAGNASGQCDDWGWFSFVEQIKLEKKNILLDRAEGTNVSFTINGESETFLAHRAVLAARSPVFKAELFGSMAEAKMPSITLHDIAPAAFRVMLQFMYTDALPGEDELGDSNKNFIKALNKRAKTSEPEARTTILGSAVVQLRVDYEQVKKFPVGKAVHSDIISAGGHLWGIECYPRGGSVKDDKQDRYLSIFLRKKSKSSKITANFSVFRLGSDGQSCTSDKRLFGSFENNGDSLGWRQFFYRTTLEEQFSGESQITFVCTIMVIDISPIPVPPSDIGTHLGCLLDRPDGTDVSFIIDGETFPAHRWVLAARSPVFRAELFGSMTEATMQFITLHEIAPATFRIMLRFMYTDVLPGEDELGDSPPEIYRDLLAAADRYALDRLKLMCAQKLLENVTVDIVATMLACAETYNCPELKNQCLDFFAVDKHFKKAVFTDGFVMLKQKFPSITDVLRDRVGT
ncbi:unnamed protein product [Alopecurus aequalis]